jgi:zinc/manganese transport system permease protein
VRLAALVAPGFFANGPVRTALALGALVALVTAPIGTFTVLRGQSFAGEALGDISTTGGSAAYLASINSLWGFAAVALAAAALLEALGVQRARGRDVATGVVLGAALGLAALLLYLNSVSQSTTGATVTILFGSIFTLAPATLPLAVALAAVVLAATLTLFRPLLLASISPELAAARGIAVRRVGLLYLLALALAVALASITIGTVLSTALLIGPAATALRITRSPGAAVILAVGIGVAATWLGVLLAYDSYDWPPTRHGWPVSFFVVTLVLLAYLLAGLAARRTDARPLPGQG